MFFWNEAFFPTFRNIFQKGTFLLLYKNFKKNCKNLEKTLAQQKISNLWYPPLFRRKTRSSGSQSNNKPPHEKTTYWFNRTYWNWFLFGSTGNYTFTHNELQQFVKRVQIVVLAKCIYIHMVWELECVKWWKLMERSSQIRLGVNAYVRSAKNTDSAKNKNKWSVNMYQM